MKELLENEMDIFILYQRLVKYGRTSRYFRNSKKFLLAGIGQNGRRVFGIDPHEQWIRELEAAFEVSL